MGKEKLKVHAHKVWKEYEKTRIEKARIAIGRVTLLKEEKSTLIKSLAANPELAQDIKEEIENLKLKIAEHEKIVAEAQDFEKDFNEFIDYAFDFLDNLRGKWWEMDKQTMLVCKQLVFPGGIQMTPNKKVYIPEISPIYGGEYTKKSLRRG
ncbi:MAG TPA: hypothetical protein PLT04_03760 [Candidatus Saccharibacteria bacterium]|nr:hypothetical protein [Candidatus Saccharibacteria bacterium]